MSFPRFCLTAAVIALAACSESANAPTAVRTPGQRPSFSTTCDVTVNGCVVSTVTIGLASVDLQNSSITSTQGVTYYVTDQTQFHSIIQPPGPSYAGLTAWNALVQQGADASAFLAVMQNSGSSDPWTCIQIPNPPYFVCWINWNLTAEYVSGEWEVTDITPVQPVSLQ